MSPLDTPVHPQPEDQCPSSAGQPPTQVPAPASWTSQGCSLWCTKTPALTRGYSGNPGQCGVGAREDLPEQGHGAELLPDWVWAPSSLPQMGETESSGTQEAVFRSQLSYCPSQTREAPAGGYTHAATRWQWLSVPVLSRVRRPSTQHRAPTAQCTHRLLGQRRCRSPPPPPETHPHTCQEKSAEHPRPQKWGVQ